MNAQAFNTKTYLEGKPFPIGTFVLKPIFTCVYFSDNLKPLEIGLYKILDRHSNITYELFSHDGTTFHTLRNH